MYDVLRIKPVFVAMYLLMVLAACSGTEENVTRESTTAAQVKSADVPEKARKKVILFFGNSLTAGFGLESHESFPSLIQARLDSLGYDYEVINAGVSGETTATGSNRIDWVAERQPVDIFILELGANDGLRGVPVTETRKNLELIIDKVRQVHPDVKIMLAGMMVPPSMGPEYSNAFRRIFPEVARSKNALLIPFLLENVAGIDSLNLPDGIHPNQQGQKLVVENVWEILKGQIEKNKP